MCDRVFGVSSSIWATGKPTLTWKAVIARWRKKTYPELCIWMLCISIFCIFLSCIYLYVVYFHVCRSRQLSAMPWLHSLQLLTVLCVRWVNMFHPQCWWQKNKSMLPFEWPLKNHEYSCFKMRSKWFDTDAHVIDRKTCMNLLDFCFLGEIGLHWRGSTHRASLRGDKRQTAR